MFELAARGHDSVFELLVACILSIRTRDETTLPACSAIVRPGGHAGRDEQAHVEGNRRPDRRLHVPRGQSPKDPRDRPAALVSEFGGVLPCDADVLQAFHGVGPKCANLVVGIACGQPLISVDIHVHRVTNRWGIVHTATPEKTMTALEAVLAATLLGGDQRFAGAVRQAYLHRRPAEMFDMPTAGDVPAGRRDGASMSALEFEPQRSQRTQRRCEMTFEPIPAEDERIAYEVIGAAIEVHRLLGPGFLEKIYERAMAHELELRGLLVRPQQEILVPYKGILIPG